MPCAGRLAAILHAISLIATACGALLIAALGEACGAARFGGGGARSGGGGFRAGAVNRSARPSRADPDWPAGGPYRPGAYGRPRPVLGRGGVGVGTGIILGTAPGYGYPPPGGPYFYRGGPGGGPRTGINVPAANEQRFVPDEVVLEFPGNLPPQAVTQLTARQRLATLDQQNVVLTNSTFLRARITDGRPVRTVLRALGNEVTLRSGQPNYLFVASQDATHDAAPDSAQQPAEASRQVPDAAPAPSEQGTFVPPQAATPPATPVVAASGATAAMGDPAQYTLAKLHVTEAHNLADGHDVLVAVIDSGVDAGHPELAGVVAGTFDALGTSEKPHAHGTAVAGAIAAHSRLMGIAPAARILAIRAFGATANSAEGTTFAILKGLDYAAKQNARVINMSFAGPADPVLGRALNAARARGAVLVAASGNLGPDAAPQYPAADPNVIAVSATDADDHLFKAASIGPHIAVTAPGVEILLPAPDASYDMKSGTSFAAAEVSGIVALMLQRQPGLSPGVVRYILQTTAKDLGTPGRDPEFGAGLADAYQAILAVDRAARPVSAAH